MTLTTTEITYITITILLSTLLLNAVIHFARAHFAARAYRNALTRFSEECYLDEDDNTAALAPPPCYHKRLTNKGFLSRQNLPTRATHTEKALEEHEIVEKLEQVLADLRQKYDEVTYLGKHTSRGRESDTCLYARVRVNGLTQCTGEVASVHRISGMAYIRVNLNVEDAQIVREHGWTIPCVMTSPLARIVGKIMRRDTTEIVMYLPKNADEIEKVMRPILDAAACWMANVEQTL